MTDLLDTLFSAWGTPSADGRATKTDAAIGPDFYYAELKGDHVSRLIGFSGMREPE